MKQWFNILLTCIVLAGTGLSGCSKFLEVEPSDRFTGADFWKNESDAEMGVTAAYSLLRTRMGNAAIYVAADFRPGNWNFWAKKNFIALATNQLQSADLSAADGLAALRDGWGDFYKSIAMANLCLAKIPEMSNDVITSDKKASFMGEARFIRSFNYYLLVTFYGDVPLQFDPYDTRLKARSNMLHVLDTCITDLQLAVKDLPEGYADPTFRAVRATKGAALALIAHMYAWKAGFDKPRAKEWWQKCADACQAVTNLNQYHLMPYAPEIFKDMFKGRSEEGIWELSMDANYGNSYGGFMAQWVLHQPILATSTTLFGGLASEITIKREFIDKLYPPGKSDARFTLWFDDPYSTLNPQSSMFLKYSAIADPATRSFDFNILYFRYAGVMLLQAEALAEIGGKDTDAISLLNEVKRRASAEEYTGTGGKDLKDAIFLERTRELMGEGQRWTDLVRTGRVMDINECENYLTQDQFDRRAWTWPIPVGAIRTNPLLVQTAYWVQ
ncbi:RagB/SusD family nutrient uptake outer membrane protein [Chitinophaga sp. SYP-B3965]|uniref:RagB/SusD family nutrient uptake outer membrane protein n=1 Tax=Chitinophaga sp. SYP-B3965 TaxID=2663120 RepID=UPI00129997F8|nr:RagB/SusD family nutrient uptake outer membrane protein [Chitinophaga sp. SYP-B3965]MRG44325.1 RagB/SusD family nutrient uptake outer membrane protein [Chitinophaga sp. SYP-B3965]